MRGSWMPVWVKTYALKKSGAYMRYLFSLILLAVFCPGLQAAYIYSWRGEVDLRKTPDSGWERVSGDEKLKLSGGEEMRTGRASTVEIYMEDGSRIKVAPLSSFKMAAENSESVSVGLYFGRVRSWVKKFSRKFEVRTPSAVCAVRGTDFMVSADAEGNSRVEVYEGSVLTGDSKGNSGLVREGQFSEIPAGGRMKDPGDNPNEPSDMNSAFGSPSQMARNEIYNEISKEDVIARAQEEMQSSEYQLRKTAVDAFGNRVRMEEYTIRPEANQFKYVVLNTRDDSFNFGKILFTFNNTLPSDLSLATRNMLSATGAARPAWELTEINSIMSNTLDKVTEDSYGGKMIADNPSAPTLWTHFFANRDFYVQGGDQAVENGGMGKMLWSYSDANSDNVEQAGEYAYLGGSFTVIDSQPDGTDVFHSVKRNTFADGTWIQAEDFVLFDDGKILAAGDFAGSLTSDMDTVTDKLNFQRVYTSSLFSGRKIDLEYSAKLLKDAGLLRF